MKMAALSILILLFSTLSQASSWSFNSQNIDTNVSRGTNFQSWSPSMNYGIAHGIEVDEEKMDSQGKHIFEKVYFSIRGGKTEMYPADNLYYISKQSSTYHKMYDAIRDSSNHKKRIYLTTEKSLDNSNHARVLKIRIE